MGPQALRLWSSRSRHMPLFSMSLFSIDNAIPLWQTDVRTVT
jgi:hypothetical protein